MRLNGVFSLSDNEGKVTVSMWDTNMTGNTRVPKEGELDSSLIAANVNIKYVHLYT